MKNKQKAKEYKKREFIEEEKINKIINNKG